MKLVLIGFVDVLHEEIQEDVGEEDQFYYSHKHLHIFRGGKAKTRDVGGLVGRKQRGEHEYHIEDYLRFVVRREGQALQPLSRLSGLGSKLA